MKITKTLPLIIGILSAFAYLSLNARKDTGVQLESDLRFAGLVYQNAIREVKNTAKRYARRKTVVFFFNLNLDEKLGGDLAKAAHADRIDMVTLIDTAYHVRARSHAPKKSTDLLPWEKHVEDAFLGEIIAGPEVLTMEELREVDTDTFTAPGNVCLP